MDNCKTIILLVSGNAADNGSDLETFAEKYELLLNSLLADGHRVVVAGLLPRETVDLSACLNRPEKTLNHYGNSYVLGTR